MPQNYSPEFKKKLVRLHEAEGGIYKSIIAEYGVSKASVSKWCKELREEWALPHWKSLTDWGMNP